MSVLRPGQPGFDEAWAQLRAADPLCHPRYGAEMLAYQREYHAACHFDDVSAVITADSRPAVGLLATIRRHGDGRTDLCAWGPPLLYLESRKLEHGHLARARKHLKAELVDILDRHAPGNVSYRDPLDGGALSYLGRLLLGLGGSGKPVYMQMIDLAPDEAMLTRALTKSFRHQVKWGHNNLTLTLHGADTMTAEVMEAFRQLHIQESGRETRSQRSWMLQYEAVKAGKAFVITGHLDGELVTCGLFTHSHRTCSYGVSASARALFHKPLSHVVLWTAILHARALGCRWFEMGDQLFPAQGPSAKELGICLFKRGFGGETMLRLDITLPAADYQRFRAPPGSDEG